MTYSFISKPKENEIDMLVATALNGEVYTENKRIHIKNNTCHYVYKLDGSPAGWYRRNLKTSDDFFLGEGASPTIELENLTIKNNSYWLGIIQPEVNETPQGEE